MSTRQQRRLQRLKRRAKREKKHQVTALHWVRPSGRTGYSEVACETEFGVPREMMQLWSRGVRVYVPRTSEDRSIRRRFLLQHYLFLSQLKWNEVCRTDIPEENPEPTYSEKFCNALKMDGLIAELGSKRKQTTILESHRVQLLTCWCKLADYEKGDPYGFVFGVCRDLAAGKPTFDEINREWDRYLDAHPTLGYFSESQIVRLSSAFAKALGEAGIVIVPDFPIGLQIIADLVDDQRPVPSPPPITPERGQAYRFNGEGAIALDDGEAEEARP